MAIDDIAGDGSFFTGADLSSRIISNAEIEAQLGLALKPAYVPEFAYRAYMAIRKYLG